MVVGCIGVVLGIVLIAFSTQIVSILPIFLGVLVVIGGLSYFFNALGAQGGRNWILVILSALIVIGGIVVIINPFSSLLVLFRIFGVLLILSCVDELITYFSYQRLAK